ncbi:cyclin-D1-1, partial [Trifolium pratense]
MENSLSTMDYEPPYPSTTKDMETIRYYFDNETLFMATRNFFTNDLNILYRMHAVSLIATVSKKDDPDAYVPYLAMNYFDRFICRCDMRHVEGQTDTEKIRLIAISCFTLSAKMRTESFSVEQFLIDLNSDMNLNITHRSVMRMESLIQKKLDGKMKSVTAFCFLNHYYAYFKPLGGFKRRSINEIIVEAQGLFTFVDFMPSEIALAALAAAATIAYPKKKIAKDIRRMMSSQVEECRRMMVNIGNSMKIKFDTSGSSEDIEEEDGTALIDKRRQDMGKTETSQLQIKEKPEELFDKKDVAAEETDAEKRSLVKGKGKGKAVEKVKEPQKQMEGSISEIEPKKFMNFELNWETDVPSLEVGIGHPPPGESTVRACQQWLWSCGGDEIRNAGMNLSRQCSKQFVERVRICMVGGKHGATVNAHTEQNSELLSWSKPTMGSLKCNIDAACYSEHNIYCVGACLHDESGRFAKAFAKRYEGKLEIYEAE